MMIANAPERFDEQGNLKDAKAREMIQEMLHNFVAWIRQVEAGKSVRRKASAG